MSSNSCYICHAEAVTRCYTCGQLVCQAHGANEQCLQCNTGFTSGDPRAVRVGAKPRSTDSNHGWWRPRQAEEYHPPACYECKGLARALCRHCQSHYCPEHAGPNGLCQACGRSARLGLYVFAGLLGMALVLFLFSMLFG